MGMVMRCDSDDWSCDWNGLYPIHAMFIVELLCREVCDKRDRSDFVLQMKKMFWQPEYEWDRWLRNCEAGREANDDGPVGD